MTGWTLTDEFIGNTLHGDVDGVRVRIEPPAYPQLTWTCNDQPLTLSEVLDRVPAPFRQWAYDFTAATVVAFSRQAREELADVGHGRLTAMHRALELLQAASVLDEQAQAAREQYDLIAATR